MPHVFVSRLSRLRGSVGLLEYQRADRDWQFEVRARVPRAVGPLAVRAAVGRELGMKAKIDERVGVGAGDDVNRAAVATIPAAWAAAGNELLAAECQTAATAATGR